MRFSAGSGAKAGEHALDRGARSHLAALLPPYAVGQRKQPAVSARLGGRGGEHVAKIVLVLLPYSSAVRKLPELDLQHRVLSGAARRGVGGQQASIAHQDIPHIAKKKRAGGPFPA